jgi:TPR repeat protein
MVTYGQPNLGRMNSHPQAEYTVIRDGEVLGTFSAEQLSSGVKRGTLLVTDHYWREGWPERQSLADLFPSKARRVSTKERMELRHVGIALVMLLGIAALGFAVFVIIVRSNRVVMGTGDTPALVPSPVVAPVVVHVESTAPTPPTPPTAEQKAPTFAAPKITYLTDSEVKAEEIYQRAWRLGVGEGVPRDDVEAARTFEQAALLGHAEAQYDLAAIYRDGVGIPKDAAKAAVWFTKAAEQGHAEAQFALGRRYSVGEGVLEDTGRAIEWYTKAAEQGLAEAQFRLGTLYLFDKRIPKDPAKAVDWFTKAATKGHIEAQGILGFIYHSGNEVPEDATKAAEWYTKSAEQGNPFAQVNLGVMYIAGKGVLKDTVRAHFWWNIANTSPNPVFHRDLTLLENGMTPAQIAEAQAMAREFKPRKALTERDDANPKTIADSSPKGTGTGFFITTDGYFVTNHHVVEESSQIRVNSGNGIKIARIIRMDKANDLALLKVEGTFPALPIESSRHIALGNTVATVGFPNTSLMGFSPKLAKGDIASLAGIRDDPRYFQISVPVQPGNSGGALVDGVGNVVGVVSAKLSAKAALASTGTLPENVNYAVKSSFLLSFLESAPELVGKLPDPYSGERKFEDVVKEAQQASVLVLVY